VFILIGKEKSDEKQNILISGASIATGIVPATLLRAPSTVVEKEPALREGGYKVDIRGAAVEVDHMNS
jgi:hypothetical protein